MDDMELLYRQVFVLENLGFFFPAWIRFFLSVHPKKLSNLFFHAFSWQNAVQNSFFLEKFCPLKAFRQLLPDGLLDDTGSRKTDECPRLREDDIS